MQEPQSKPNSTRSTGALTGERAGACTREEQLLNGSKLPTRHGGASRREHLRPLPGLSAPAGMRAFLSPSPGPAAQVHAYLMSMGHRILVRNPQNNIRTQSPE